MHALRQPAKFRRDVVGFVFQLHHLLPSLTVQENVELTMVAAHVPRRERHARGQELLDEVGLGGRSTRRCRRICPAGSASESRSRGRWRDGRA